jgi:hypothetical protein
MIDHPMKRLIAGGFAGLFISIDVLTSAHLTIATPPHLLLTLQL